MSTKQSDAGLGVGAVLGIAAIGLAVVGFLIFGRTDEPAPTALEMDAAAPAARDAAPGSAKRMGERFSGTDGSAPRKLDGDLRAEAKGGVKAKRAVQPSSDDTAATDVDLDRQADNIPALRRVVTEDPDPERRLAAVTLLGIADSSEAVGVLAQALHDEDENVRMEAVLALADLTDEAPVDVLAQAMNDPSAEIRYEALDALSDIESSDAIRVIEAALQDPDEDVRELAEIIHDLHDDSAD